KWICEITVNPSCVYSCKSGYSYSFSYPCWTFYEATPYYNGYCPDGRVCCYTESTRKCYTTT
ncbi:MAG: hypothetical protein ACP5OZ_04570, partial [Candidatus Woesearchaeota archaeon]